MLAVGSIVKSDTFKVRCDAEGRGKGEWGNKSVYVFEGLYILSTMLSKPPKLNSVLTLPCNICIPPKTAPISKWIEHGQERTNYILRVLPYGLFP